MQNYQGNAANGARSPAVTTSVVVDGDIGNAANLTAAVRTLADQVAWLQAKLAVLDDGNTFSGTNTFNGDVNVQPPSADAHPLRMDSVLDKKNMPSPGLVISPSSGIYTVTASTLTDVPNLSVSIHLSGRAIAYSLIGVDNGQSSSLNPVNSYLSIGVFLAAGATEWPISIVDLDLGTAARFHVPPGCVSGAFNLAPTGNFTIKIKANVQAGGLAQINHVRLAVREI